MVTRIGCAACDRTARERGVEPLWVGRKFRDGKVSPYGCPFDLDKAPAGDGQAGEVTNTRDACVDAMERIADGVGWEEAGRGLRPHKRYRGAAVAGLDERMAEAAAGLGARMAAGEELWLQCSCTCPCAGAQQQRCHARVLAEWSFALACSSVLGVSCDRRSPLMRALMSGRKVLALLYAGPDRPEDGCERFVEARGWAAASYDTVRSREQNLLWHSVQQPLRAAGRAGWINVFCSPRCESFTCLRFNPPKPGEKEAPPLRLRSYLPGLPPTPPGWEAYLAEHEEDITLTFDLGEAVMAAGGRFGAEGPIDRGDEVDRKHYFRRKYAEHAPLSLHPRSQRLQRQFGAVEQDVVQCACGAPWEKGTTIIADPASAATMQPVVDTGCVCLEGTHQQARGRDEEGQSISKMAANYPSFMHEWIAVTFTDGTAEEVAEVMERAVRVKRDAQALEAAMCAGGAQRK